MLTTRAEQEIYISELRQLVDKVESRPPPPEPIEADGFEMQHPAAAIRQRLNREAKRHKTMMRVLEAVYYIGGVAAALIASTLFLLSLVKPSIFNL